MSTSSANRIETKGFPRVVWGGLVAAFLFFAAATFVVAPGGFRDKLRLLDSGICSQWEGHTFYPAGAPLPLCARNTGIYLGFFLGIAYLVALGRAKRIAFPPVLVMATLVAFVGLMGIDGLNSTAKDFGLPYLYEPHNLLRLGSGLGMGISVAIFLLPALGILLWREGERAPIIGSFADLTPLLVIGMAAFLAVASQVGLALYPVAIASTAGVVILLSIINLLVLLAMTRWQNAVGSVFEMFIPSTVALFFALSELIILALIKQWALSMLQ